MDDTRTGTLQHELTTDVLVCDDQPAARHGLASLLTPARHVETVRVVDRAGLVDAFTERPADLVLIGLRSSDTNSGQDPVQLLLSTYPEASVVVYGLPADADLLTRAVVRGARGLMVWNPPLRHRLPNSVSFDGMHRWPTRSMPGGATPDALTERELQVLQGMSGGRSNGEIGRHLFLAEDTVKTHARRLFSKLGAHDRAHAVALGLRNSLLS